ncbi:ArsA family ATPase [Streptomyces fuscigenes]|uniref:ArsA family ATPase n=1 Tax=Streptomyces fuscigenes TaxID=1528880 RepID=UPI001F30B715|nr:ArsA family ATPase [Streptomyces fuscigenes]MCF3960405.1 ArsA family ATPase [Streptomyces fuscigenes]
MSKPQSPGGVREEAGRDSRAAGAPAAGSGSRGARAAHDSAGSAPTGVPSDTPALDVDALLDDRSTRIIVCCGSGGVGKTTTAAALGVRAAERGRKVVVLTIDPARRLAQSMGIDSLDNTPRQVKGVEGPGELHAMMLDMKRTFDEIVESHADAARAQAILQNPFYQSLSAGFAGTQEYMAMEKLGQLRARDEWDLIVVDTPPSRSALDFLDAPKRLGSFLDGRFIRLLMAPAKAGGRAGMRFLNVGMTMMTGTLGKVLGGQFLNDVQTFVAAMDTMFGGFRTRADATYRLLQAPGTAFLVVAAPERDALREAAYFVSRLAAERMPLAGLVLNRVHDSSARRLSADRARAAAENLEEDGIVDQAPGNGVRGATPPGAPSSTTPPSDGLSPETSGPSGTPENRDDRADDHGGPHADDSNDSNDPHRVHGSEASDGRASDSTGSPDSSDPSSAGSVTTVEQLTAGLLRLHADRMHVMAREQRTRDRFTALHPEVPVIAVPALPGDVHDLVGLRAVGDRLAGDDATA